MKIRNSLQDKNLLFMITGVFFNLIELDIEYK